MSLDYWTDEDDQSVDGWVFCYNSNGFLVPVVNLVD